jgi:peptide chain release factor 2
MAAPDFWSDQRRAAELSRKAGDLRKEIAVWEGMKKELAELSELVLLEGLEEEVSTKLADVEKRFADLEFRTLFSGEYDAENAILAIHAGSGGTEANDWTEMLLRMYLRFAERHQFQTEILSESRGEEVGFKSVMVRVTGRFAYGYLRSEAGVHRLVRISPFDAEKMRHTTFALVEVLPELEEVKDIELDSKDLRIDTFMAGGHGGQSVNTTYSAVRVVHLPTGITVNCQNERSQLQNKETAIKILKSKLHQLAVLEQQKEKSVLRGEYASAEWGNQIRSYVLHPYKLVKDHRTDFETQEAQAVLDGGLDSFMEAYLRSQIAGK